MNNYGIDLSDCFKSLHKQYQSLLKIAPSQINSDISLAYTILEIWLNFTVHMTFRKEKEKQIITVTVDAEFEDYYGVKQKITEYLQREEFVFTRIRVASKIIR